MNIDPELGTPNIIEFENSGDNVSGASSKYPGFFIDLGALSGGESKKFNVNVSYSGSGVASKDITVSMVVDQALLNEYNAQNGTHYIIPPASVFSVPGSAVIKSGTRKSQVEATITNSPDFDFNTAYAIPLKISGTSDGTISNNFGKAVYAFGVRNIYDGVYSVTSGNVQRYTNPTTPEVGPLNGSVAGNPDLLLKTVGANTVEISNLQWANAGGGVGGIANLRATIDPVTNLVTMSALGNATLGNWAGKVNKYDPATKTFYLAFRWNPTSTVREYETVIKYEGPR